MNSPDKIVRRFSFLSLTGRLALHLILLVLGVFSLFPMLWMLSTAFKVPSEIFTPTIELVPHTFTLENFTTAFNNYPLVNWIINSTITSSLIMTGRILIALPAAYAFARFEFPGKRLLYTLIMGTLVVPYAITILPNYLFVAALEWRDTYQGVVVPQIAFCAFAIFLFRQYILTIPTELLEAARIDGASRAQVLWRIVVPLIVPAIAAVAVLSFLTGWNSYLWPLLVLSDPQNLTLPVGLALFVQKELGTAWGPMMVTALISSLPPILVYLLAQRYVTSAFVTSGLKG
jgi:sn-glycerol 3-phosphate transport system permease protein